jgi:hypothetical protein
MASETAEIGEAAEHEAHGKGFTGLIRFTFVGFAGGLIAGVILDQLGFQRSGVGQWFVRTLSGEGESIFEGIYALRQRLRKAAGSMAEAYGWGKVLGMPVPWVIDWISRAAGVDVYGVGGFYIPYFYALSDQIGANISGLVYLYRKERNLRKALGMYFRSPVMVASLLVITLVPLGLFAARLLGFSPTTQIYTALETIVANLCWVPPLVGWLRERRQAREAKGEHKS